MIAHPFTPNHHRRLQAKQARAATPQPPPVPGAKWLTLDQGKFALVDEADYPAVADVVWHFAMRGPVGYAAAHVNLDGVSCKRYLHRFLLKPQTVQQIDHINGDGLDCRRINMRLCTSAGNNRNRRKSVGTSQFKGVSWDKSRNAWRATIKIHKKLKYLGRFDSEQAAAKAYDSSAEKLFGEFARLNFP